MDQSFKLKECMKSFYRGHQQAWREILHSSKATSMLRVGAYSLVLGGLLLLCLLKWTLLPPFPASISNIKGAMPPSSIFESMPAKPIVGSVSTQLLKITPAKPPFNETFPIQAKNVPLTPKVTLLPTPNTPFYWTWLKPILMLGEIVPFIFFFWIALRGYQISHRQRDWIMLLMGAREGDIRRLLHYRAMILALGTSGIGLGAFSLLALWRKEVPLLPELLGWQILIGVIILAIGLSSLAAAIPPADRSEPML